MDLKTYENICRFCLKPAEKMQNVFTYILKPGELTLVSYIRKLTDIKLLQGEFLPNSTCTDCLESINASFTFSQMCISSDELLKKEETRRQFRKIEEEALLDESDLSAEVIINSGEFSEIPQQNIFSVKCEGVLQEDVDTVSKFSGAEPDAIKDEKNVLESDKVSVKVKEKYKCLICEMKFNNKLKFNNHQKRHDETLPFKCSNCLQAFSKQAHLKVHLRSHAKLEEKKFSCQTCGKHFIYAYLLKIHEYKHSNIKPFPCTKCGKGCLTSENFKRHMKTHEENYVKKEYSCTVCRKQFSFPSSLAEHMRLHTGEKPHLCSICGKGFRQSGSLHFHYRIHTGFKPFACGSCSERFKSRSLLKVHMRKHTDERPFVCDSCGMAFRQSSDLKSHMRTHTGEKPVLCTLCGKRMSTTSQLTVHMRTHTGEKPYSCEFCQKAFGTKTLLQKHRRIHTGERPYVCTTCNKAFNQGSTLKSHLNTHKAKPEAVSTIKRRSNRRHKDISNEEARVKIEVGGMEKNKSCIRTEFTVILPSPIPSLTSAD